MLHSILTPASARKKKFTCIAGTCGICEATICRLCLLCESSYVTKLRDSFLVRLEHRLDVSRLLVDLGSWLFAFKLRLYETRVDADRRFRALTLTNHM